jgi:hypothetical protein
MFPAHLSVTRAHLGTMRSHFGLARPLIHGARPVSSATPSSGCFGGVHFGLISRSGSLISGLGFVPVCATVSCPRRLITSSCSLTTMFSYVPGFLSTLSRFCSSSASFSFALPGACALAINIVCIPDLVFTFARACTGPSSSGRPGALSASFALFSAVGFVE